MQKFFLILGSNFANRKEYLRQAKENLNTEWARIISTSSVIETPAWPDEKQPPYLNEVLLMETDLDAFALLRNIMCLERKLGRVRDAEERYAPRKIDIDILKYADEQVESDILTLPHPQIESRAYVKPLMTEALKTANV